MRARNIKPGFFTNDHLAQCDPLARLLFAGLWMMADREGRLEDRPLRIKATCLPYDNCDIHQLLGQLAATGFIIRYSVDNSRYIHIVNFNKHQNPHTREASSTIPPPNYDDNHLINIEPSARQCLGMEKAVPSPADSLIPDSLIPEDTTLLPAREKFSEFDESNEDAAPVAETTGVPSPQPAGSVPAPGAVRDDPAVATFRRVQHWLERQIPEFGANCWPTATIHQWLDSGADPERDIFPTVERLCRQTEANGGRIRSLSYFTGAIADAVRVRTTPLPYNPEIEGNPYANTTRIYRNRPGKPSWSDALGNVLSKYGTH